MKSIHIFAVVIAILLPGCKPSNSHAPKDQEGVSPDAHFSHQVLMLKEGDSAYVRIREFDSEPKENAIPEGDKATLVFGDEVKLIQKQDGLITLWLVAKGQTQAWAPAYILTENKAEVDFLKASARIPEKMSFVTYAANYGLRSFGTVGIPLVASGNGQSEFSGGEPTQVMVVNSTNGTGIPTPVSYAGVFAFKGNAVLFDDGVEEEKWKTPPVFDKAQKPFQLSPSCLYFCVADGADGDKRAFECIDLVSLKIYK